MAAPVTHQPAIQQLYSFTWISDFEGPLVACDDLVAKYGIHSVINVHDEEPTREQKALYKQAGVAYTWFKTHEFPWTEIVKRGVQVARLVRERQLLGQATLVHCWAGANRSVCCVLVARMLDQDSPESLEVALAHIRSIRLNVRIMPHFLNQLERLQCRIDKHFAATGERMHAMMPMAVLQGKHVQPAVDASTIMASSSSSHED